MDDTMNNYTESAKKGTKKAPETKEEKFVRVAEQRMNKAISDIYAIGELSDRKSYEYTDEQVSTMSKALKDVVIDMEKKFKQPEEKTFKF